MSSDYDVIVLGGVNGLWPLTHVGKYQARWSSRTFSVSRARPTTRLFRVFSTPTHKLRRWALPPAERGMGALRIG